MQAADADLWWAALPPTRPLHSHWLFNAGRPAMDISSDERAAAVRAAAEELEQYVAVESSPWHDERRFFQLAVILIDGLGMLDMTKHQREASSIKTPAFPTRFPLDVDKLNDMCGTTWPDFDLWAARLELWQLRARAYCASRGMPAPPDWRRLWWQAGTSVHAEQLCHFPLVPSTRRDYPAARLLQLLESQPEMVSAFDRWAEQLAHGSTLAVAIDRGWVTEDGVVRDVTWPLMNLPAVLRLFGWDNDEEDPLASALRVSKFRLLIWPEVFGPLIWKAAQLRKQFQSCGIFVVPSYLPGDPVDVPAQEGRILLAHNMHDRRLRRDIALLAEDRSMLSAEHRPDIDRMMSTSTQQLARSRSFVLYALEIMNDARLVWRAGHTSDPDLPLVQLPTIPWDEEFLRYRRYSSTLEAADDELNVDVDNTAHNAPTGPKCQRGRPSREQNEAEEVANEGDDVDIELDTQHQELPESGQSEPFVDLPELKDQRKATDKWSQYLLNDVNGLCAGSPGQLDALFKLAEAVYLELTKGNPAIDYGSVTAGVEVRSFRRQLWYKNALAIRRLLWQTYGVLPDGWATNLLRSIASVLAFAMRSRLPAVYVTSIDHIVDHAQLTILNDVDKHTSQKRSAVVRTLAAIRHLAGGMFIAASIGSRVAGRVAPTSVQVWVHALLWPEAAVNRSSVGVGAPLQCHLCGDSRPLAIQGTTTAGGQELGGAFRQVKLCDRLSVTTFTVRRGVHSDVLDSIGRNAYYPCLYHLFNTTYHASFVPIVLYYASLIHYQDRARRGKGDIVMTKDGFVAVHTF